MSRRLSRRRFLAAGATAGATAAWSGCAPKNGVPDPVPPVATGGCDGRTFSNWAGTISCRPARYCQPRSEAEVVQIVNDARTRGQRVRTVGAGHSWAPLALTRDVLVNLDQMQQVLAVDPSARTARVQAGIRLKKLLPALAGQGLGMANLGSVREQSLAGATATGTHGTGLTLGSIHTQILGLRLVTGTGEVRSLTPADGDLFRAALVSLGALGIVTEVTLQCVPNYDLEYAAYWCRLEDVLPRMDALLNENTRVRLWWLVPESGDRDRVILTTLNPPGAAAGAVREISREAGAGMPSRGGTPLPQDTESLKTRMPSPRDPCQRILHFTDNYVGVLNVPLLPVPHRECEYAVPVEHTAEALRLFRVALEEGDLPVKLPIEVRWVAKDDALLSPARDRDVCYIGASSQGNANEVFQRFEPIMRRLDGRPHWGKCFSLTQEDARAMYPATFDRFREIRREMDPQGVFANEHLQRLLD